MAMKRDGREVGLPVAPVVPAADVSQGLRFAGQAAAQSGAGLAQALGGVGEELRAEAEKASTEAGRDAAAQAPLQRDEEGRLQPPDLSRSFFSTAAQEAYRTALASRYSDEFVMDNGRELLKLRQEHRMDPDGFREAAERFGTGLLSTMPAQVRPVVAQAFGRQVAQHYNGLWEQRTARDVAEAGEVAQERVRQLGRDALDALRGGNREAAGRFIADVQARVRQAVDQGLMTPQRARELETTYTRIEPLLQEIRANAGAAGALDPVTDAMRRITRVESGAQGDAAANPASSARGRLQITDGLWREYAPRLGLTDAQRTDGPSQERVFRQFAADVTPQLRGVLGRAPEAGDYYAMWLLGRGAGMAFLRAEPGADARATYRAVLPEGQQGDRQTAQAFSANGALLRPGMTVGQVLEAVRGRVATGGRQEAGDRLVAAADALLAGPGHPAWTPGMAALNPDERRAMAQTVRAWGGVERSEDAVMQARAIERAQREEGRLLLQAELTTDPGERAAITERLIQLQAVSGSQAARQFIRQGQQEAEREALQQSSIRASVERIRALSEPPDPNDETGGTVGRAVATVAGRPLAVQAVELGRIAQAMTDEARERQRLLGARQEFNDGLRRGAHLPNSETNQALARELTGDDLASPRAQAALPVLAASQVLPTELGGQMEAALRTRDSQRIMAFASMGETLTQRGATSEAYQRVVPREVRETYAEIARRAATLPAGAQREDALRQVAEDASRRIADLPRLIDVVRSTFGETPADQNKAIDETIKAGMQEAGVPTDWVPPPLQRQLRDEFLRSRALTGSRDLAIREALEVVGREWSPSRITMPPAGVLPEGNVETRYTPWMTRRIMGLFTANPERQTTAPAWVQHDAARITAVHGTDTLGRPRTTPSWEWQQETLADMLRRGGADPARAATIRLGQNARWMAVEGPDGRDAQGRVIYQLAMLDRNGNRTFVEAREPDGTVRGRFQVVLQAEADRLNAEARTRLGDVLDREAARRDAARRYMRLEPWQ